MLGPRVHRPSEPQVVTCTSSASPAAATSRRSASITRTDPRAEQHGAPSGFLWSHA